MPGRDCASARRQVLAETNSNFLQAIVVVARNAKGIARKGRVGARHFVFNIGLAELKLPVRTVQFNGNHDGITRFAHRGEIGRRIEAAASSMRTPFVLNQRFGWNIGQSGAHDGL